MTDYHELLAVATSILLIDWPSRDVPDTLARHGFRVVSADGPRDDEYSAYELARALSARAVWLQSGSPQAREIVERAGLLYFDRPYLPDAVRGTAGL